MCPLPLMQPKLSVLKKALQYTCDVQFQLYIFSGLRTEETCKLVKMKVVRCVRYINGVGKPNLTHTPKMSIL